MYIYISRVEFSLWGIERNLATSQKFAHSTSTWNNFFLHQRLVPSPLSKNCHVI